MGKDKLETVTFTYDGRRYYVRAKTKQEAIKKAALQEEALRRGEVAKSRQTVDEWMDEYIATYKATTSKRMVMAYRSMYRNSVQPYIGRMKLSSVKPTDIQRIFNNLPDFSQSHVRKIRLLLASLFQTAVDNDLITKSPVRNIHIPDFTDGERRALTEDERRLFLTVAPEMGDIGLFFLVMYYCGLRPSEVARLTEDNIDRKNDKIIVPGTKTKNAVRDVPIPSALTIPVRDGYIFVTERGCPPGETARRKWWIKLVKKMEEVSGKPVASDLTAYCLRHDFCTRGEEAGIPINVMRQIMGHSHIDTTSKWYTHGAEKTFQNAREKIDQFNADFARQVQQ